jgi:hypothetical protein
MYLIEIKNSNIDLTFLNKFISYSKPENEIKIKIKNGKYLYVKEFLNIIVSKIKSIITHIKTKD